MEVECHLVVLVHGLQGSREEFVSLEDFLTREFPTQNLVIYGAASNEGKTSDGIDTGGLRLYNEVLDKIASLEQTENKKVKYISFIGHSLGGLYSRYCIGKLYEANIFDKISPLNYMTMATPHLGSKRRKGSNINSLWNYCTKKMVSRTGLQLVMHDDHEIVADSSECSTPEIHETHSIYKDKTEETEKSIEEHQHYVMTDKKTVPLLVVLADPNSSYFKGLAQFSQRVLYCNVSHDFVVGFSTSAIQPYNPCRTGEIETHFSEKYPCVLDCDACCKIDPAKEDLAQYVVRYGSHGEYRKTVLKNLCTLQWVRVGAKFGDYVWSHRHIIGKSVLAKKTDQEKAMVGLGVLLHVVDHFQLTDNKYFDLLSKGNTKYMFENDREKISVAESAEKLGASSVPVTKSGKWSHLMVQASPKASPNFTSRKVKSNI